jgi:hypothetical protein
MVVILYSSADAPVAERVRRALAAANLPESGAQGEVVAILSSAALQDAAWQRSLDQALDHAQPIIPVLAEAVALPKLIDHLTPINAQDEDAGQQIAAQIAAVRQPGARLPLRVRTPAVRRANNQAGLLIALIVIGMFIAGIWGVGVLNIEAPVEEFNAIDTEVAATRDVLIGPTLESYLLFLPGSAEEAAVYPATVQAVPTRIRPFVAATATAVAIEQQD